MTNKKIRDLDKTLRGLSYEQLEKLWEDNRRLLNQYRKAKTEAGKSDA